MGHCERCRLCALYTNCIEEARRNEEGVVQGRIGRESAGVFRFAREVSNQKLVDPKIAAGRIFSERKKGDQRDNQCAELSSVSLESRELVLADQPQARDHRGDRRPNWTGSPPLPGEC